MITDENNPTHWFEQARERLRSADVIRSTFGISPSAVELLHESVERFLKGYLVSKGWKLEKTHDLSRLIDQASNYDQEFGKYCDMADELTQDFWSQHYPGGDTTDLGAEYEEWRVQIDSLVILVGASPTQ